MRLAPRVQLRQLVLASVIGALLALVLVTVAGIAGWQRAGSIQREADFFSALHADAERLRLALTYLTLLQPDPAVASGIVADAGRIRGFLDPIALPVARRTVAHLHEVGFLTGRITDRSAPQALDRRDLFRELRVHTTEVSAGLWELAESKRVEADATQRRLLLGLSTGVVVLALLSLLAFTLIYRRLIGPIRSIEAGLGQLADGSLEARIEVARDDELGQLARAFNHMAEQRQRHENRLLASEQRLRLFATATTGAVFDADLVKRTIWWDERFQQLTGYPTDSKVSGYDGWLSVCHPEDQQRVVERIAAAIKGADQYLELRHRFRHANGRWRHALSRALLIRDQPGRAIRMVGGMTDISERVAMDERLVQGQRLEAVGHLTGGVAHDFNNLLTVILGTADLLDEQLEEDPDRRLLVRTIVEAAQRGASLTRHLLAFARKQPLEPSVIDVNHLLAGIEPMLHRTLGEDVELEVVRGAALWPALVDPAQLEHAVLNLCLNARDAMPEGGRLTVETSNRHLHQEYVDSNFDVRPGQYVLLAVSDTGTGIAPEQMQHVFEPFFTTKEKGKGTGLGLSMVFGFIKQSGGHVKIYSEPGQGTTVRMYLPRATVMVAVSALPVRDIPIPRGAGEVILVVEDEPAVLSQAMSQVAALGYRPIGASTPESALAILRERDDIALLFTDIVMPGMNGRELVDAARSIRPGLRVLFTSGYTENAVVHHGRVDPGVHLLAKPYQRADLARRLHEALHQ